MQNTNDSIYHDIQPEYLDPNEIKIIDIVKPILQARKLITIITVSTILLTILVGKFFQTYESQGVFQFGGAIPIVLENNSENTNTEKKENNSSEKNNDKDKNFSKINIPGMSISDYKRFSATFNTVDRFRKYIEEKHLSSNSNISSLLSSFNSEKAISEIITPTYPYTKLDAKEFAGQPSASNDYVTGLRFSYRNKSPQIAQEMVKILGQYTIDSIVYQIYYDYLHLKNIEIRNQLRSLENKIILANFNLETHKRKFSELEKVVNKYRILAIQQSRPLSRSSNSNSSSNSEDQSYSNFNLLLVNSSIEMTNALEEITKLKREQKRLELVLEYYENYAEKFLDKTNSALTLLEGLEVQKEIMFKQKDLTDELVKQVYNVITIENQMSKNLYFEKSRFIAGPNLPTVSSFKLSKALATGMLLGLIVSMILIFATNWWKKNNHILFQ